MSDSEYFWIQVCDQLKWHNKGTDCCIDTLNRLWQKHLEVKSPGGEILLEVPTLSENMLMVQAEQWPLDRLVSLTIGHTRERPHFFPPIIILSWFERNFLIDGNNRVNFWRSHNNQGPHAVLRIRVKDV